MNFIPFVLLPFLRVALADILYTRNLSVCLSWSSLKLRMLANKEFSYDNFSKTI